MTTQEPVIVIDNVHKSYGTIQAVKGISIRVEQGEIFGFLGPNGAGKTTTIRCMLDVIRPTIGSIRVLGLDAQHDTMALHQLIGYLPGDMTGRQVINYFSHLQGREPVLLDQLVQCFDVEMKRPLRSYSKGMRRRIGEYSWRQQRNPQQSCLSFHYRWQHGPPHQSPQSPRSAAPASRRGAPRRGLLEIL